MKKQKDNILNELATSQEFEFLKTTKISFSKTKEEIWENFSNELVNQTKEQFHTRVISLNWLKISAAAVILLLIGTGIFLKFYTKNIYSKKGEHISHILPDGSKIEINAESSIYYHPYWWSFEREINFEGEAFFEVTKGKNFKVFSANGFTQVLGTSFNIYARKNDYKVYCETGKVKVSSTKTKIDFIISRGEMAVIDNNNKFVEIKNIKPENILGWKNNKFIFTSESLSYVFDELERQYDIKIETNLRNPSEYIYTGYFSKDVSAKTSLNFICKSFNFTFVELGKSEYKVLQNEKCIK